jgi:hypothetical protein
MAKEHRRRTFCRTTSGRFLQNHFETDEVFLRKFAYAEFERHAAEHRSLLARMIRDGRETNERLATTMWSWAARPYRLLGSGLRRRAPHPS